MDRSAGGTSGPVRTALERLLRNAQPHGGSGDSSFTGYHDHDGLVNDELVMGGAPLPNGQVYDPAYDRTFAGPDR